MIVGTPQNLKSFSSLSIDASNTHASEMRSRYRFRYCMYRFYSSHIKQYALLLILYIIIDYNRSFVSPSHCRQPVSFEKK